MADRSNCLLTTVCWYDGRALNRITVWCGIFLSVILFAVAACPLVYGIVKREETYLLIGGCLLALCGLYLVGFPLTMWVLRVAEVGGNKDDSGGQPLQQNSVGGAPQQDGVCVGGMNNNDSYCDTDTDSDSCDSHSIHYISDHRLRQEYKECSPLVKSYPSEITATHVTLQGMKGPGNVYQTIEKGQGTSQWGSGKEPGRHQHTLEKGSGDRLNEELNGTGTRQKLYHNSHGTLPSKLGSNVVNYHNLAQGGSFNNVSVDTSGMVPPPCYNDAMHRNNQIVGGLALSPRNHSKNSRTEPLNPRSFLQSGTLGSRTESSLFIQPGTVVRSNESVVEFTV